MTRRHGWPAARAPIEAQLKVAGEPSDGHTVMSALLAGLAALTAAAVGAAVLHLLAVLERRRWACRLAVRRADGRRSGGALTPDAPLGAGRKAGQRAPGS